VSANGNDGHASGPMQTVRIATRRSPLAQAQGRLVGDALVAAHPQLTVELVTFVTAGDRRPGDLSSLGGKGLFTGELTKALGDDRANIAVHSAKDLPAEMDPELTIAAAPPRADPRDSLVSAEGWSLAELPAGATVGTSSLRRRAQLLAVRGDLKVVPIRGNLATRIGRAIGPPQADRVDAVVVAMAGLLRSGLADSHRRHIAPLPLAQMIPAAGQGTLAIQTLTADMKNVELLSAVNDESTLAALYAERRVVAGLAAGCGSCLAVHVVDDDGKWHGLAMAARPDGGDAVRIATSSSSAELAGEQVLDQLLTCGADQLLRH